MQARIVNLLARLQGGELRSLPLHLAQHRRRRVHRRRRCRRSSASRPTSPNFGVSQSIGATTGGKAEADLRGLSGPTGTNATKTLVLLNGRRLANHAFDAAAVDLNQIPLAAIERVEVLKDGASAIYGTDAIGGVINFILRRDFKGLEVRTETADARGRLRRRHQARQCGRPASAR